MLHAILPNLQVVLFFIYFVLENLKKILIHHFAIGRIIVYYTTIIPNILNQVVDNIELRIVKD